MCVLSHLNRQTFRSEFYGVENKWEDIEVKFIGHGHRSKVKVTRSKTVFL